MEAITDCKRFETELRVGNMINMTSAFNVTGPLCERIVMDSEELGCVRSSKDLLLPVEQTTSQLRKNNATGFSRTASALSSELLKTTPPFTTE